MEIKILGSGCASCNKLYENTKAAVEELGLDVKVEKVEDIMEIMAYGVMRSPNLVVDGNIKASGKVLSVDEIKAILQAG